MMLSNCCLEKILKSPLDNKETKPVNPKGNQINPKYSLEVLIDAEAEAPILWPTDTKS